MVCIVYQHALEIRKGPFDTFPFVSYHVGACFFGWENERSQKIQERTCEGVLHFQTFIWVCLKTGKLVPPKVVCIFIYPPKKTNKLGFITLVMCIYICIFICIFPLQFNLNGYPGSPPTHTHTHIQRLSCPRPAVHLTPREVRAPAEVGARAAKEAHLDFPRGEHAVWLLPVCLFVCLFVCFCMRRIVVTL